jgi:hypothetical protein
MFLITSSGIVIFGEREREREDRMQFTVPYKCIRSFETQNGYLIYPIRLMLYSNGI